MKRFFEGLLWHSRLVLAAVLVMILVVRYFEFVLGMEFTSPLDLPQFPGAIALLGLALSLSHPADQGIRR